MESNRRYHRTAPAVRNACRAMAGGCTFAAALSADMSVVVTPLPPSTPRTMRGRPGTRSSRASSLGRTGSGTTGLSSSTKARLWRSRRITRAGNRHLDLPAASPQTGKNTSTETWPSGRVHPGARAGELALRCDIHAVGQRAHGSGRNRTARAQLNGGRLSCSCRRRGRCHWRVWTALRMRSVTVPGWEIIATCEECHAVQSGG
jgi:hypothetical protein